MSKRQLLTINFLITITLHPYANCQCQQQKRISNIYSAVLSSVRLGAGAEALWFLLLHKIYASDVHPPVPCTPPKIC